MDAIGLFGLFWLLFAGGKGAAAPAPRVLPAGPPAPWPQVLPPDLPAFPGPAWEYDEPPPRAVVVRAGQLVSELWRRGKGAHRTEQTEGRWITYRAEIVRSGKQGVTAWRLKAGAAAPELQSRAPRQAPEFPAILTSTSPGWPQPKAGQRVVQTVAGRWYEWKVRVDAPPGLAATIARGLAALGAIDIAVSSTPPYAVEYRLQAPTAASIPLGVTMLAQFGGDGVSITFVSGRELAMPNPVPKGPNVVLTSSPAPGHVPFVVPGGVIYAAPGPSSAPSPVAVKTLRRGSSGPDVAILQAKLGLPTDGKFGPATETAVKAYQRRARLTPDGIVGPATWTQLFAVQS